MDTAIFFAGAYGILIGGFLLFAFILKRKIAKIRARIVRIGTIAEQDYNDLYAIVSHAGRDVAGSELMSMMRAASTRKEQKEQVE